MADTATKDRVDEENLVDAAARASEELKAKTLATVRPEQQRWDEHQVAILRQLGVEDATQGDLDLFFHVCRMTGLDPFRKQIYMIGRNTKVTEWIDDDRAQNGRRKVEKWVTKYTIQTGIDGFRRNGREAAKRYGDTLTFDGPYWCGEDGEWREVWPAKQPPVAAKYTVFRNGEPFSAVVHYDEFVQTNPIYEGAGDRRKKVGEEPNSMWAKMPRNQTAKCAEAMAYRRAYPDDFGALILEDAAQPTIIDQDGNIESAPPRRPSGSGIDGVRAARERRQAQRQQSPVVDAEPADHPTPDAPSGDGSSDPPPGWSTEERRKGLNRMHQLFGTADLPKDAREKRLVVTSSIVGRTIASSNDLTDDEIARTNNQLDKWDRAGQLVAKVADILDQAAIDAARAAEQDAAQSGQQTIDGN